MAEAPPPAAPTDLGNRHPETPRQPETPSNMVKRTEGIVPTFDLGIPDEPGEFGDVSIEAGACSTDKKRPFRQLDANRMEMVNKRYVKKATMKKNSWASKAYYNWRRDCGGEHGITDFDTQIEDMPLHQFARHLEIFFQQVLKSDGKMYPGKSLQDMLFCFGRILKEARKIRIQNSGMKEDEFNIMTDPFFEKARFAIGVVSHEAATSRPRRATPTNKVVTIREFQAILNDPRFSRSNANGLLRRVILFCIKFFLVRTRTELYDLKYKDFNFLADVYGEFIEFKQRVSKTYQGADLRHSSEKDRRKPVEVYKKYNSDVYETFVDFYKRLPQPLPNEADNHPLFMACIPNPLAEIWYCKKTRVGINKIAGISTDINDITGWNITNKDLRHSTITDLNFSHVPDEACMKLTGHRRAENLHQYDHTQKFQMMAMQSLLSQRLDSQGNIRQYKDVVKEIERENIVAFVHNARPQEQEPGNNATLQEQESGNNASNVGDKDLLANIVVPGVVQASQVHAGMVAQVMQPRNSETMAQAIQNSGPNLVSQVMQPRNSETMAQSIHSSGPNFQHSTVSNNIFVTVSDPDLVLKLVEKFGTKQTTI